MQRMYRSEERASHAQFHLKAYNNACVSHPTQIRSHKIDRRMWRHYLSGGKNRNRCWLLLQYTVVNVVWHPHYQEKQKVGGKPQVSRDDAIGIHHDTKAEIYAILYSYATTARLLWHILPHIPFFSCSIPCFYILAIFHFEQKLYL